LIAIASSSSLLIQRVGTSHRSGGGSNANGARRVQPRRKTTELRGARAHHGGTSASLGLGLVCLVVFFCRCVSPPIARIGHKATDNHNKTHALFTSRHIKPKQLQNNFNRQPK
jgi:hypothetical protein